MTHRELDRPGDYRVGHASICLRPSDLEPFRHVQGHPDSSSLHPNTPGTSRPPKKMLKAEKNHQKQYRTRMPSEEGINIGSPCRSPTDYNHTLTLRPNGPGGSTDTASDGNEGINIGSPMDHQLTHHTQTSRNWNTAVQAVQVVQEHHVMHRKTGKLWRF